MKAVSAKRDFAAKVQWKWRTSVFAELQCVPDVDAQQKHALLGQEFFFYGDMFIQQQNVGALLQYEQLIDVLLAENCA